MADTKISALTAVTTPDGATEFAVNESGTSKKITLAQINTFADPLRNISTAAMASGFASDTYVTRSDITVPQSRIQAGSVYRCRIVVVKTAAGTATPTLTVRYGTAGTTADTARLSFTFVSAQTAAADTAEIFVSANFNAVGSGTSGILSGSVALRHNLATTGFCTRAGFVIQATSSGFDTTPASSKIGVSMNGGASAAWTVHTVETELINVI